ncbi:YcxB family protein [Clostridium sp. KNHs216]|uniref:YcxB family protein n=1 Tax=Clostridium sp. KNHs216 TaxID=1550235 RepID=UPI00114F1A2D|nr:YcxB family protein [Clostridium sp. KNHs216]TQI68193.1 YcxB-like protein [Clostridium sp. KNHs216]
MELRYSSTADDYRRFAKKKVKPRKIKVTLIITAVIFVTFLLVNILGRFPSETAGTVLLKLFLSVLYGGIFLLILNIKVSHDIKKNINKLGQPFFDSEKSITLNKDGLAIKSKIRESKIPYDAIKQFQTDTEFIVIAFKAGDMVYIPITGIKNREIIDDFVSLLKSKIA